MRSLRNALLATSLATAAAAATAPAASAQGTGGGGLAFAATPYLWIAGLSGSVTTRSGRSPTQDIEASFGDTLSNLSGFAFMGAAEARYGRFGLVGDIMTLTVESDFSTPRNALFAGGTARATTTTGAVLGLFRVVEDASNALDLGAGARIWSLSTKLSLHPGILPGQIVKPSTSWADPLIALRYTLRFSERWGITVFGDIGGFGAGSQLTWEAFGTLNYRPNSWSEFRVGYRHLYVDRSARGTEFDIGLSGPIIGTTFRF